MSENKSVTEPWHLSKAVDVSNILAIIGLIVSLGFFVHNFGDRITVLEVNQRNIVAQQQRDREDMKELLNDLRNDVKYIRKRVDQVE